MGVEGGDHVNNRYNIFQVKKNSSPPLRCRSSRASLPAVCLAPPTSELFAEWMQKPRDSAGGEGLCKRLGRVLKRCSVITGSHIRGSRTGRRVAGAFVRGGGRMDASLKPDEACAVGGGD